MFAILKKLVGGRAAKARKAAAGFRPALEALESRDLMSVAGYSPVGQKDFFINSSGVLKERDQYGSVRTLASSASQVSVLQSDSIGGLFPNGIVPYATARADILMQSGDLYQWDDATGLKYIASGVKQVSAGFNGNSAVLWTNGNFSLYNTDSNTWTPVACAIAIASATLGTDLDGLPMLGLVTTGGVGYEWRAGGGFENLSIGRSVQQISAGVGSHCAILFANGDVCDHFDFSYASYGGAYTSPGYFRYVDSGAVSVSCGTDWTGNLMFDYVKSDGTAWEQNSAGWKKLGSGVAEVDAGQGGVTDLCYSNGNIARYNDNSGSGYADMLTTLLSSNNRNFLG
jgi:hypothetical protein